MRKKKIVGGVTLPNFKICSLISVIKTMWHWLKDRQIGEGNRVESANRPTHLQEIYQGNSIGKG